MTGCFVLFAVCLLLLNIKSTSSNWISFLKDVEGSRWRNNDACSYVSLI